MAVGNPGITIRATWDADDSDRAAVLAFLGGLTVERETFAPPAENVLRCSPLIMAWAGPLVVGLSGWQIGADRAVYLMCVHRDHQGQGLGRRLMLAAIDLAPRGLVLCLAVRATNARARRLYESTGWRETGSKGPNVLMRLG